MRKKPRNLDLLIMMCVFLVSFFIGTSNSFAEDVVIIVNSSVTKTDFTKNELKDIFLGNTVKWPDNSDITVAVSKSKELQDSFLAEYVQRNPTQFDKTWKMIVFTGKGKPPSTFDTAKEILEFVAATKGAIGYIFPGDKNETVKVIVPK